MQGSEVDRLLGLRVRIPPGEFFVVSCECCVLSGSGICDGPIPRPEKSYRMWCVIVYDLETSRMRRPWPALGSCARKKERDVIACVSQSCKIRSVRRAEVYNAFFYFICSIYTYIVGFLKCRMLPEDGL